MEVTDRILLERIEMRLEAIDAELEVTSKMLAQSLLFQQISLALQAGAISQETAIVRLQAASDLLDDLLGRAEREEL